DDVEGVADHIHVVVAILGDAVHRLERVEASKPDVVLLDESADVSNGVLVDGNAAAALHSRETERLRLARAREHPALLEQLLEIDAIVLARGVDAPLDFDIGVVAVPVEHPNAVGRGDAQQRKAGRAREKFNDLEQALARATVGDGGGHEAARVSVAVQELTPWNRRWVPPQQHRNGPRGTRRRGLVVFGDLVGNAITMIRMILGGAAVISVVIVTTMIAAIRASFFVSGVHNGASKHTSASFSPLFGCMSSQSLTSPLSGKFGNRTIRIVFAAPYRAVAASSAFLRPASSLSSRIRTSRPASALTQSSVQSPHATVVAQWSSEATRSASFSPSQTKTHASGYFRSSGRRYRTRRTFSSLYIHLPPPSGWRWRKDFGSKRSTW